ncbi:hypothetical protein AVEN_6107-1 [Araneus ventricosus]|uniref:Uncharacterized protein n=1 Tax=Araneus ventricosus TaxID=182803 RepID=A0A4Y2JD49_ARAVE|nr:hypothetical protein AVEN_6107-1 [Araneus ventricosus]
MDEDDTELSKLPHHMGGHFAHGVIFGASQAHIRGGSSEEPPSGLEAETLPRSHRFAFVECRCKTAVALSKVVGGLVNYREIIPESSPLEVQFRFTAH